MWLSDGGSFREQLTAVDRPDGFGYRVTDITGPLRWIALEARGAWTFRDVDGATHVQWRYAFVPRAVWTRPLLRAVLAPLWRRYMQAGLTAVREVVERGVGEMPRAR